MIDKYKTKDEIRQRLSDIDRQVEFAEDGHTYKRLSDDKFLKGMSSLKNLISKPFLMFWTTKENYKYMMSNWDLKKDYNSKDKKKLLMEAKNAYKQKSQDAMDIGSDIHAKLEEYIKGKISGKKGGMKIDNPIIKHAVKEFVEWANQYNIEWIASEAIVFSNHYDIAGTFDALCYINGHLTVIDFKTGNNVGEDNYIQLAGYKMLLREWGINPAQRLILQVPKAEDKFLNEIVVPTPYDLDRNALLGLIELRKFKTYVKNHKNAEVNLK